MKKVIMTSVMMFLAVGLFAQESELKNEYYADGSLKSEFNFIGNQTYEAIYYFTNGQVREQGYFRDGKTHGLWLTYNNNGQIIREGYFNDNKKDGKWRTWSGNGQLVGEAMYLDDVLMTPGVAEK